MDSGVACPTCSRHRELCALEPCTKHEAAKPEPSERPRVTWLPVDAIDEPEPARNARREYQPAALTELIASVREHGILQPLGVRQDGERYVVIFGVRRLRAARNLGVPEVPCVIRGETGDAAFILNLVENLQRAQLSAAERVTAIERLVDTGLGVRELARRTGLDASTISRWLRIERHPELKAALQNGTVDIGRAKILVEAPSSALPRLLVGAASLPPDQLRDEVQASKLSERSSGGAPGDATLRKAVRLLRSVSAVEDPAVLDELSAEVARLRSTCPAAPSA